MIHHCGENMIQRNRLKHLILFSYFFATTLSATTLYVDNTSSDGTWPGAYTALQTALAAATSGDQIWVAAGTYTPTSGTDRSISFNIPQGVKVYGGFIGGEAALDSRDWENNVTILSGNIGSSATSADNSYSVVKFTRVSNQTVLDGFTIRDGQGSNGGGIYIDGGGSGNSCQPQLSNLIIINNYVTGNGGGLYLYGENYGNASPVLTNCNISSNEAQNGAGLYLHGGSNGNANPSIDRCIISGNLSTSKGGGLYLHPQYDGDCKPQISNTLLSGNEAVSSGGAIYNYAWDGGEAEPMLYNCTLVGNASPYGGAISSWLRNGGQAGYGVYNTIIWGNETSNGGQVRISQNGEVADNLPKYYYCLLEGSSSSSWDASYGPTTGTVCIDANPLFVDDVAHSNAPTTSGNYQLELLSPAMASGASGYVRGAYDLAGNDRIANTTVEIGAYEHAYSRFYVDCDATGANDGSSWSDAFTDLTECLVPQAEIWVAAGTYYPTSSTDRFKTFAVRTQSKLYGGFTGTESSLDQRDPLTNITILSGNIGSSSVDTDNSYHVVVMDGCNAETILDGFTITRGHANGSVAPYNNGGGILIDGSGELYTDRSTPTLRNLTITDNYASSAGGGISCWGDNSGSASPTIENCIITENEASVGGGIYLEATSSGVTSPSIDRCIISNNSALNGGGFYLKATVRFWSCKPTISNTLISGNSASSAGGGIYNQAFDGGETNATLYNCTIVGNAANYGGAINTFMGISETSYLGKANYHLISSIVWGNQSTNGQIRTICSGSPPSNTLPSFNNCDIEGSSSTAWDSNISPNVGLDCISDDPDFVSAVAYSSAPTTAGNYRLERTSPCIGVGSMSRGDYDLDGADRIANLIVDMGAYEQPVTDMFVDADASGANDGSSWTDAYTDLQSALANARGGVQIWVAEGSYMPTSTSDRTISFNIPSNVQVYGGFDGTETELSQRNAEDNVTTLSGDIGTPADISDNSHHVVAFGAVGRYTILDGFTITLGKADGTNYLRSGGGIYIDVTGEISCQPNIVNCRIINNQAQYRGGAICLDGVGVTTSNFSPVFDKCVISGNLAGFQGGAITMDTFTGGEIRPKITNCLISGNKSNYMGGAIVAIGGSSGYIYAAISGTTIAGNSADDLGGAFYLNGTTPGFCSVSLQNSIVWGNSRKGRQITVTEAAIGAIGANIEGCGGAYNWNTYLGSTPSSSYNTLDALPLFVNLPDTSLAPTTTGDFHLYDSSPCIGVGSGGTEDITGAPRPGVSDFGAYENPRSEKLHHLRVNSTVSGSIHNGISWTTAFSHPGDALRASGAGDTIWVAACTYYPDEGYGYHDNDRNATFKFGARAMLYGGFDGTETSFNERDASANLTILSGDIDESPEDNSGNAYHVVSFPNNGLGGGVGICDVTISGGNADLEAQNNGGGIYIHYNGSGDIRSCIITDNYAQLGGGIFRGSSSRAVNISDCSIVNNSAGTLGGGIYSSGPSTISNSSILSNTSAGNAGGLFHHQAAFELNQTRISGNYAAGAGGGLYLQNPYAYRITNCLITGNKAEETGDGVYLYKTGAYSGAGDPIFLNCTIAANSHYSISWDGVGCFLKNSIAWSGITSLSGYSHSLIGPGNGSVAPPGFYDLPDASEAPTLAGDFRLSDISPCIGAGSPTDAPTVDLYGNVRSGNPDQGAIENPLTSKQQRVYVGAQSQPTANPGSSWDTAYKYLQDAIHIAAPGDSIWVSTGTYYPGDSRSAVFAIPSGVKFFGGFAGTESALEARDWFQNETVLSGDIGELGVMTDNSYCIVRFYGSDTSTVLDGFTIRDGYCESGGSSGISTSISPTLYCDPVIRNCRITNNYALARTAGIYLGSGGSPTIEHCVIAGTWGKNDMGGAISIGGASYDSAPKIEYCTIVGNAARAIYADASTADKLHITVSNSIIWNNSRSGGEIKLLREAQLTISNSIITDSPSSDWNPAYGTDGGNNRSLDPQLTLLPDTLAAPTSTGDFTPLYFSNCIEAGDSTFAYDESGNHAYGWKTDIGAIEYAGTRVARAIDGPGEYLFGGDVRMKVNVTVDNLDSLDITVHTGEAHPENNTLVDRWYDVRTVGTGTFDLTLSYLDSELNDESEEALKVYRYTDDTWSAPLEKSGSSLPDNWVTISNQTMGGEYTLGDEQTDSSLPVELSEYSVRQELKTVALKWTTDSEIENLGFILERSERPSTGSGRRLEIASYLTDEILGGQGSTNAATEYQFVDDDVQQGSEYVYYLFDVDYQGQTTFLDSVTFAIDEQEWTRIPDDFSFGNVYPNPFNPQISLPFALPETSEIRVRVYDIRGREVLTLVSGSYPAGRHTLVWNGTNALGKKAASGVYILSCSVQGLESGSRFQFNRKVLKLE